MGDAVTPWPPAHVICRLPVEAYGLFVTASIADRTLHVHSFPTRCALRALPS